MKVLANLFLIIILFLFYIPLSAQTSLRFYGNGVQAPDQDRVKIRIDDPTNSDSGPPADIGAEDFTIEFWMKASLTDNTSSVTSCGTNINWIYGNIIIDRDRYNQDRKFGLSVAGGYLIFGVSGNGTGDRTICGSTFVLDDSWHHVAMQRRLTDGHLWLYVDGVLEADVDGPDGDISYPDAGTPCSTCCGGNSCDNSDPFLVLGAEKHDAGASYPSYNGFLDELRLSNSLRYSSNFSVPQSPFLSDTRTMALYHFDEGNGDVLIDDSGAAGGPSPGVIHYGGSPAGPIWLSDTPFSCSMAENSWSGPQSGTWYQNPMHWSQNHFPNTCEGVEINSGYDVSVTGESPARCLTLDVMPGAVFTVTLGSQLEVGSN